MYVLSVLVCVNAWYVFYCVNVCVIVFECVSEYGVYISV